MSPHRDTLNPKMNLVNLHERLRMIEHYKALRTPELLHWPHYAIGKYASHINKYKFNYALKAFLVYNLVSEVNNMRYQHKNFLVPFADQATHFTSIGIKFGLAGAALAWL